MRKYISFFTAAALSMGIISHTFVVSAEEAVIINNVDELRAAVTNGGTYKVADDVTQLDCSELQIQVRKSIVLDLNDAVVLVNNDGFDLQNYEMNVTIENGTISGVGNYTVKAMAKTPSVINLNNITTTGAKNGVATANSYHTVNINGGDIEGTTTGLAVTMGYFNIEDATTGGITLSNESTLKAQGSSIESVGNGVSAYNAASASFTDCKITSGVNTFGIFWKASGNLEVTDTEIEIDANGKGVLHTDTTTATVTVTNSTLSNTCETAYKANVISSNSSDASSITVNSGTYNGVFAINAAAATTLTINGGLFSSDPSAYLADGLGAAQNTAGMYEVMDAALVPTPPPATEAPTTETPTASPTTEPGDATPKPTSAPTPTPPSSTPVPVPEPDADTQFVVVTTADELRAVTSADAYIRLGANIDLDTSGIKTKCPTYLDLNGHTLTGNCGAIIEAAHSLVLTDSSEDKGMLINTNTSTSYGLKCAAKNTDIKVEGAVVKAGAQAILINGDNSVLTVNNSDISGGAYAINAAKGNVVINNSVFNSDTEYKGYALYANGTNVVINSGVFNYNGTVSTIAVAAASYVTINDGEFYNANKEKGAINNVKGFTGTITINGGTFENTFDGKGYSVLDGDEATTEYAPTINITGGTFKSPIKSVKSTSTTNINVTGGIFHFDPTAYVDASKATIEDNGEGIYTVNSTEPAPTEKPTDVPTEKPTEDVTEAPTEKPTDAPTEQPTPEVTPTPTPNPGEGEDDEPSADVKYADGKITAVFANLETDGTVCIAEYEDGILVSIKAVPLSESVNIDYIKKTDEIKVYIWDMKQNPLFDVITLQ